MKEKVEAPPLWAGKDSSPTFKADWHLRNVYNDFGADAFMQALLPILAEAEYVEPKEPILTGGDMIRWIKAYRERHHVSLKEAKDAFHRAYPEWGSVP